MKFKSILFLLVFLLSFQVYGADITTVVTKEQNVVEPGGTAIFNIKITNKQIREDTFQLKVNAFSVAPFSDAIQNVFFSPSSTVAIPSNQEKEIKARVVFLDSVRPDRNYIVPIEVVSLTNSKVREVLDPIIYVISPKEVVTIFMDDLGEIIPGRDNPVKITLKNNANVRLSALDIFYTASVFNFEDKVSLEPFEEKGVLMNLKIDPLTEKGEYSMAVRLYEDDKIRGSSNFRFNVGANPDLTERERVDRGLLSYVVEIIRENEGNIEVEKTVKYPVSGIQRLFIKTNPEGTLVRSDDGDFYEWNFVIPPGDIYKIEIIVDYRWPFFSILGALIVIGAVLFLTKKDIKLVKEAFRIHEKKDEPDSVKVLLHLKNKSLKEIYNIKILDFLPRYLHGSIDYGTLKPVNIQEGNSGRRIVWEIPKIDPGEERIISYKAKSKLKLVGRQELPQAIVQYYGRGKRLINIGSNRTRF
ncbi:MAG: hypothetical protein AABX90_04170 [Nanoarchaeota archaeon]